MPSAFRLPIARINRRLAKLGATTTADAFRPEVLDYAAKSLATALLATPVRDPNLIQSAQEKQYQDRINYIPSVHWDYADPRLIVRENGEWLFFEGKWYRPDIHRIPAAAWSAYEELSAERRRRMQTEPRTFIEARKQARFLYRKTWWQVAQSLGVAISASANVLAAVTRRKPKVNPPKGYAQVRGGKETLTVVVRNPFLDQPSKYKDFSWREILSQSAAKHRRRFVMDVENKVRRMIRAAARL